MLAHARGAVQKAVPSFAGDIAVRRFRAVELRCRPGFLLRGACAFGLAVWAGALFALTSFPRIEAGTWASAFFMSGLFAVLLAVQNAAEIRADASGLRADGFLRSLRCPWAGVGRPRQLSWLPGLHLWIVPTHAGTVVFSSLWRGHRELARRLLERS